MQAEAIAPGSARLAYQRQPSQQQQRQWRGAPGATSARCAPRAELPSALRHFPAGGCGSRDSARRRSPASLVWGGQPGWPRLSEDVRPRPGPPWRPSLLPRRGGWGRAQERGRPGDLNPSDPGQTSVLEGAPAGRRPGRGNLALLSLSSSPGRDFDPHGDPLLFPWMFRTPHARPASTRPAAPLFVSLTSNRSQPPGASGFALACYSLPGWCLDKLCVALGGDPEGM